MASGMPDLVTGTNKDGSVIFTRNLYEEVHILSKLFPVLELKSKYITFHKYLNIPISTNLISLFLLMTFNRLSSLNVSKSLGPDNLHPRVLNELSHNYLSH